MYGSTVEDMKQGVQYVATLTFGGIAYVTKGTNGVIRDDSKEIVDPKSIKEIRSMTGGARRRRRHRSRKAHHKSRRSTRRHR